MLIQPGVPKLHSGDGLVVQGAGVDGRGGAVLVPVELLPLE